MKKIVISFLLTIPISLLLFRCGKLDGTANTEVDNKEETQIEETETEETKIEEMQTEKTNAEEADMEKDEIILQEEPEKTKEEEPATENVSSTEQVEDNIIVIDNPGYEYYCNESVSQSDSETGITLVKNTQEKNQITDIEKWEADNGLTILQFPYSDDHYRYETSGDNGYETYLLTLTDLKTQKTVTLDFTKFQYGAEYREEDLDFIKQRITYAQVENGILYISTSHNTYAESSPQNAYITAIDLSDYTIIWKTEPLTCNSYSFVLLDQALICGYGFTDEDDYVKVVNKKNGVVTEQIPIASMAEYIIRKENTIYIRTYNTNYTFLVKELNVEKK